MSELPPCCNVEEILCVSLHWHVPFIEVLLETVQVVWQLVVVIVKSTLRVSLLKGAVAMPGWQVAQMQLGDPSDN